MTRRNQLIDLNIQKDKLLKISIKNPLKMNQKKNLRIQTIYIRKSKSTHTYAHCRN